MKKQNKPTSSQANTPQKQELSEDALKFYPLILTGAALVAVFSVLLCWESDYLYRIQELNLFLYTPLFFKQQMVVAGGMLTYLGTWFTQFFYHPWLGTLILCLWLGLMMWLTKRVFNIPRQWALLLLVPAALVLLIDFDLGYWIYYLKLRGHFFIAVIGLSLALTLVWAYRSLEKYYWLSRLLIFLTALVAYPLAGFYGLLALFMMGVISWKLEWTVMKRIDASIWILTCIIFTPLFYYRYVYYQANSDNIWRQALPDFSMEEGFSTLYYPYILLVVCLVLLAAFYQKERHLQHISRKAVWWSVQALLAIVLVFGTYFCWYKDKTFHEEIQMTNCVDRQDWQGVLDIMAHHEGDPTRMMVLYKNLSLFRLGRAGNEMYNYRDGSRKPESNFELRVAQIGGKNIYLYYGLPNYCYRWCLEDGVEYGWRVEHLKLLARCAILNGEPEVAKKYLDLLKQTRYHAEWASQYEPLLNDNNSEKLSNHPELGMAFKLMSNQDILASDQSLIELFLLNTLAYRVTDDPLQAELVLLSALQLKDIQAFWRAFFQYAPLIGNNPMPRHFQEAAYLYGHLEKNVNISGMPFDPMVKQTYDAFMQAAQQYRGISEERMKEVFRPQFGHTFYYNYFLMRNMKSY